MGTETQVIEPAAVSQADRILALVRDDILTAKIRPGAVIVEPDLSRQHGVSRTPVREALRILAVEGWVSVLPRRGYIVRPLSFHDVREVMALRLMLEPALAAAAAKDGDLDLVARLRDLLDAQYSPESSLAERLRCAESFHLACAGGSGNVRAAAVLRPLIAEISRLHHLMPRVRHHITSDDEREAHAGILQAIADRDGGLAERRMRAHLEESSAAMVAAF